MVKIIAIIALWIASISVVSYVAFFAGCSNGTDKSNKCEIPQDGYTYRTTSYLESGPQDLCKDMNPFYEGSITWMLVTETEYDDNCKSEPDKISSDKCSVRSYTECVTGMKFTTVVNWIVENQYNATATLNDNDIYKCVWSFTMER